MKLVTRKLFKWHGDKECQNYGLNIFNVGYNMWGGKFGAVKFLMFLPIWGDRTVRFRIRLKIRPLGHGLSGMVDIERDMVDNSSCYCNLCGSRGLRGSVDFEVPEVAASRLLSMGIKTICCKCANSYWRESK